VWQIELIDQVTWCRNEIRTKLAQKNAANAQYQDIVQSPTIAGGKSRDNATHRKNSRETRVSARSCFAVG
jgi:hypothetical protein